MSNPTNEFYSLFSYIYDFYNANLFGGVLSMPIIVVTRRKNVFGYFSYRRWKNSEEKPVDEIAVNPQMFDKYPITELCQTIVHEMCHQWQYQYGTPTSEGYHNTEWSNKMLSLGLTPSSTGKPGGSLVGPKMGDYPTPDGLFLQKTQELLDKELFNNLYYQNEYNSEEEHPIISVHYTTADSGHEDGTEQSEPGELGGSGIPNDADNEGDAFLDLLQRGEEGRPPKEKKPKCMDPSYMQELAEKRLKIKYTCEVCDFNVWGKPDLKLICGSCKSNYVEAKKKQSKSTEKDDKYAFLDEKF